MSGEKDLDFKRHICLYMHLHQPYRVRPYTIFDVDSSHDYWNNGGFGDIDTDNRAIFLKVAEKSYRPMLKLLLKLLKSEPKFRVSLSVAGTFLEQALEFAPDVVDKIRELVATGRCEIVAETYYHSLAFFHDLPEFEKQVSKQMDIIKELFGVVPTTFRNTELAYNDALGKWAAGAGFKTILAEGWDPVLGWRSPNFMYKAHKADIKLMLKNYRLSDDIAFRFSNRSWKEWPLTAEKYLKWIEKATLKGPLINLFMDFETFGEHQWADTGVFDFFEHFVHLWCRDKHNDFLTLEEASSVLPATGEISMPSTVTWADTERDLTAWDGNEMQKEALREVYAIMPKGLVGDERLIDDWRRLQTSDHFYYMCTKYFHDGDVHAYFSCYESPYFACLYWNNAIRDLKARIELAKISAKSRAKASPTKEK